MIMGSELHDSASGGIAAQSLPNGMTKQSNE
jgi:hypothetical protein